MRQQTSPTPPKVTIKVNRPTLEEASALASELDVNALLDDPLLLPYARFAGSTPCYPQGPNPGSCRLFSLCLVGCLGPTKDVTSAIQDNPVARWAL